MMIIITTRYSTPANNNDIINLWYNTVKATHHFLSEQDLNLIYQEFSSFISQTSAILAINQHNTIIGFMLLNRNHIEALFINHTLRKKGIGKKLINNILSKFSSITTTVNEQNIQALQFYKHLGFQQTHREEYDQQNRPYPLLYLEYSKNS